VTVRCYGAEEALLALPPGARVDVAWSVEAMVHADRLVETRTIAGSVRGVLLQRAGGLL
jgi:hypothetical protein